MHEDTPPTYLQVSTDSLELLLSFSRLPVGLAELDLHLIQITLHLLLDSEGLVPTASLRLQGALQSIHHSLLIAFGLLHLFILLGQFTLNLSLHLVELQLSPKDFALLVLKRPLRSKSVTYFPLVLKLQTEKAEEFYEMNYPFTKCA